MLAQSLTLFVALFGLFALPSEPPQSEGELDLPGWMQESTWPKLIASEQRKPDTSVLGKPTHPNSWNPEQSIWGSDRLGARVFWREAAPAGEKWRYPPLEWLRGVRLAHQLTFSDLPAWVTPNSWLQIEASFVGVADGNPTQFESSQVLALLGEPTNRNPSAAEIGEFERLRGHRVVVDKAEQVWLYEAANGPYPLRAAVIFKERDDLRIKRFIAPNWAALNSRRLSSAARSKFGQDAAWIRLEQSLGGKSAIWQREELEKSLSERKLKRLIVPGQLNWSRTFEGPLGRWVCTWQFEFGGELEWTTLVWSDQEQPASVDESSSYVSRVKIPVIPEGVLQPADMHSVVSTWKVYSGLVSQFQKTKRERQIRPAMLSALSTAGDPVRRSGWVPDPADPKFMLSSWIWTNGCEVTWVMNNSYRKGSPRELQTIADLKGSRVSPDLRLGAGSTDAGSQPSDDEPLKWLPLDDWHAVDNGDHLRWVVKVLGEPSERKLQDKGTMVFIYSGRIQDGVRWRGGRIIFDRQQLPSDLQAVQESIVREVVMPSVISE
jgi:hypothetical protein